MRQKAVSIAPQNEAPIQIEPSSAAIPIVVVLSWIRLRASVSVVCSVFGNNRWRSSSTLASTPPIFSTWPKKKRTRRAKGKTASIRL